MAANYYGLPRVRREHAKRPIRWAVDVVPIAHRLPGACRRRRVAAPGQPPLVVASHPLRTPFQPRRYESEPVWLFFLLLVSFFRCTDARLPF